MQRWVYQADDYRVTIHRFKQPFKVGALKGQELINSAKVKNLANDFKNVPVFIYGYQDKFKALPGDDAGLANHVTGGTSCTGAPAANAGHCVVGNGVIEGAWNATTAADESYVFWQHVRLAGLAPGPTTTGAADYLPTNTAGGTIGIQSGTTVAANSPLNAAAGPTNPIRGSYVICSSGILGKYVKQLDTQMDDGNTASGSMMAKAVDAVDAGQVK